MERNVRIAGPCSSANVALILVGLMTFGRWCVVVVVGLSKEVLEGDLLKVRTNKQRRHRPINWPL